MSTAKKILSNTVWQICGRASMAALSIVILKTVSGFLTHGTDVSGYGQYTAVYEFLAFFGIAADLGLFTIGVREISKGHRERNFIVKNILGMRLVLAGLMMALAVCIAFLVPAYQGTFIPMGISIASLAVFLAILHGTISSVLQVEMKMQYATIGLVLSKVITMGWMLVVVHVLFAGELPTQESFNQLMIAGVLGNLVAVVYTGFYALKFADLRPQFEKTYWKEIMFTAVPYGLALIMNMIYFRIDGLMILMLKGSNELGYYGPPMRILEILEVIPVYFMNSVLPVLSKAVENDKAKVSRVLAMSWDVLYMMGLPMTIGLFLLAYPVIFLVSQPEFLSRLDLGIYGSDIALQILALSMFVSYLNSVFIYTLVAIGKQNALLWINLVAAAFNIGFNLWAIPLYGFRGAGVMTVLTEVFVLLAAGFWARRFVQVPFHWGRLAKATVAAALMGATIYYLREPTYNFMGLQNFNVFVLTVVGAGVYGALLWIFGALPKEFMRSGTGEL